MLEVSVKKLLSLLLVSGLALAQAPQGSIDYGDAARAARVLEQLQKVQAPAGDWTSLANSLKMQAQFDFAAASYFASLKRAEAAMKIYAAVRLSQTPAGEAPQMQQGQAPQGRNQQAQAPQQMRPGQMQQGQMRPGQMQQGQMRPGQNQQGRMQQAPQGRMQELRQRLMQNPELRQRLMQNPELMRRLMQNPELRQRLMQQGRGNQPQMQREGKDQAPRMQGQAPGQGQLPGRPGVQGQAPRMAPMLASPADLIERAEKELAYYQGKDDAKGLIQAAKEQKNPAIVRLLVGAAMDLISANRGF